MSDGGSDSADTPGTSRPCTRSSRSGRFSPQPRDAGLDFDTAWLEAVEVAPAMWREVLHETRDAWAQAYHRTGPHELADVVRFREAAREHDGQRPLGKVRLVA